MENISLVPNNCVLRLPEVKKRTGLSRSSIYTFIQQGVFPGRISLGGRCVGWLESDIEKWLQERIQKSRPSQI